MPVFQHSGLFELMQTTTWPWPWPWPKTAETELCWVLSAWRTIEQASSAKGRAKKSEEARLGLARAFFGYMLSSHLVHSLPPENAASVNVTHSVCTCMYNTHTYVYIYMYTCAHMYVIIQLYTADILVL